LNEEEKKAFINSLPHLGEDIPKEYLSAEKEKIDKKIIVPLDKKHQISSFLKGPIWACKPHAIGYIHPNLIKDKVPIYPVNKLKTNDENNLTSQKIVIRLDKFRVANYPGIGLHKIMVNFEANHYISSTKETKEFHFNHVYEIRDKQSIPISGLPIFIGLEPSKVGLTLNVKTINISNRIGKTFLSFLKSNFFRKSLELASGFIPIISMVSSLAIDLTYVIVKKTILHRPVQTFSISLSKNDIATTPKLARGSYVAVQHPLDTWVWKKWKYESNTGRIVDSTGRMMKYNYLIFSVDEYID